MKMLIVGVHAENNPIINPIKANPKITTRIHLITPIIVFKVLKNFSCSVFFFISFFLFNFSNSSSPYLPIHPKYLQKT